MNIRTGFGARVHRAKVVPFVIDPIFGKIKAELAAHPIVIPSCMNAIRMRVSIDHIHQTDDPVTCLKCKTTMKQQQIRVTFSRPEVTHLLAAISEFVDTCNAAERKELATEVSILRASAVKLRAALRSHTAKEKEITHSLPHE